MPMREFRFEKGVCVGRRCSWLWLPRLFLMEEIMRIPREITTWTLPSPTRRAGVTGILSLELVRSLACARLGQRHSGRLQAARQHLPVDMAVRKLQSTLVQIRTRSKRLGSFFPELARSSEIKHDFVLLKHSGRCRSLFHSTLPL